MGHVRRLWIPGNAGRLECAVRGADSPRAIAVVAHPHPLHGGTLHNPVIFHTDRELNRAGLLTLRFNFRGVQESEGSHDEGRGEVEDVASAVIWLRGLAEDRPLVLVGFSFGALCSLRYAVGDDDVVGVVAIGLPVRLETAEEAKRIARPLHVVQGSRDEFGTPEEVRRALEGCEPEARIHVIEGAPHLFPGQAPVAAGKVVRAVSEILS